MTLQSWPVLALFTDKPTSRLPTLWPLGKQSQNRKYATLSETEPIRAASTSTFHLSQKPKRQNKDKTCYH
ncbi:hypothetical protein [Vibrio vulnificus YJ016]|uniref:Uncharacterized protein n=1 Tax=Vibrio vulnificus (strain YJ016) TaxID=196600 RepID=Q7MKK0_VIBVY|nr:hypothetical protein [Vibrio vulnificus YJ016]